MNKSLLAVAVTAALAGANPAARSADAAQGIDRLAACAEVADTRQRLACFDREIAPFKRAPASAGVIPPATAPRTAGPTPLPAPAPVPVPAPTAAPRQAPATAPSLGQEQLPRESRPPVAEEEQTLHATISSLRKAGAAFTVTLDNGQTWRHENATLGAYLREGDAITISKGSFGSYRLTRDAGDEKNWIRVTRVR